MDYKLGKALTSEGSDALVYVIEESLLVNRFSPVFPVCVIVDDLGVLLVNARVQLGDPV